MSKVSTRSVFLLFAGLALALGVVGFWLDDWWPFAGAVVAGAIAGLALTEP